MGCASDSGEPLSGTPIAWLVQARSTYAPPKASCFRSRCVWQWRHLPDTKSAKTIHIVGHKAQRKTECTKSSSVYDWYSSSKKKQRLDKKVSRGIRWGCQPQCRGRLSQMGEKSSYKWALRRCASRTLVESHEVSKRRRPTASRDRPPCNHSSLGGSRWSVGLSWQTWRGSIISATDMMLNRSETDIWTENSAVEDPNSSGKQCRVFFGHKLHLPWSKGNLQHFSMINFHDSTSRIQVAKHMSQRPWRMYPKGRWNITLEPSTCGHGGSNSQQQSTRKEGGAWSWPSQPWELKRHRGQFFSKYTFKIMLSKDTLTKSNAYSSNFKNELYWPVRFGGAQNAPCHRHVTSSHPRCLKWSLPGFLFDGPYFLQNLDVKKPQWNFPPSFLKADSIMAKDIPILHAATLAFRRCLRFRCSFGGRCSYRWEDTVDPVSSVDSRHLVK